MLRTLIRRTENSIDKERKSIMPLGAEYSGLNLTAPTWYRERPFFYQPFFDEFPDSQWSMAQAPYSDAEDHMRISGIRIPPAPDGEERQNGFLNAAQQAKADQLVTICFGDEEKYSDDLIRNYTEWMNLAKMHYPNALVHNNQSGGQWFSYQLRNYMQHARPDFISYDTYHFSNATDNGREFQRMFKHLFKYRNLAYWNNPGNGPINFGFYLQGFRKGHRTKRGGYTMSETQIYGQAYLALLFGAKWLNIFRYKRDLAGETFWYHKPDGTLSDIYTYFGNLGAEVRNLSPYLSRLKSDRIKVVLGQHLSRGDTIMTNLTPSGATEWSTKTDRHITSIQATNSGTVNSGLRGDVYVGYFNPVVGLNNAPSGVRMAPIHNMNTKYFMIMNGLSAANTNNSITHPNGQSSSTEQIIRLNMDFSSSPVDTLVRISRSTGLEEHIVPTWVSGAQYKVDIVLPGGKADLFYWKNSHRPLSTVPRRGRSVSLNLGQSVRTANVSELDGTSSFTIEAWLKFDSRITGGWKPILGQKRTGTSRIQLWALSGNRLAVSVANGSRSHSITADNVFTTGVWHHVAIVYDGAAVRGKVKLYVDGAPVAFERTHGIAPSTTAITGSDFIIGRGLDGNVDEVRIWRSALAQSAIHGWKNKAVGSCHPNFSSLVLYWQLEGTGTVASASLGTSYAGTIGGTRASVGRAAEASGCGPNAHNRRAAVAEDVGNLSEFEFKVYPNPVNRNAGLVLEFEGAQVQEGQVQISIIGLEGRRYFSKAVDVSEGLNKVRMPLRNLANGIYIIENSVNGKSFKQKLLIAD